MSIRRKELIVGDLYQLYGREIARFLGFDKVSTKAVFQTADGEKKIVCMDCVYKHVGKEKPNEE